MSTIEPDNGVKPKRTEWAMKFTDEMSYPIVKADGREVNPFLHVTRMQTSPFTIEYFKYSDFKILYRKVKRGPGKGRIGLFPAHGVTYAYFDTENPSKVTFGCSGSKGGS